MKDVTNRFLEFYNYLISIKKISNASEFARKIQISPSMMHEIIKKRSDVGITPVQNIVKFYPNLNSEWLLTGNGEMLLLKDTSKSNISNYFSERLSLAVCEPALVYESNSANLIIKLQEDKINLLNEKIEELQKKIK